MVGPVAAGKSSLINFLFKTKLETGIGTTTRVATRAHKAGNLELYDTPGTNDDFEHLTPKNLRMFASIDLVIICYQDSITNTRAFIETLSAINQRKLVLVRTKCNLAKEGEKSPKATR